MKWLARLVVIVIAAVVSFACVDDTASHTVGPPLSVTEYRQLGFPAADRPWASSDYAAALHALQRLDGNQYPSSTLPASVALLERLTNAENLKPFSDPAIELNQRLSACLDEIDAAKAIARMYSVAREKHPQLADDYLRIQGFMQQAIAIELSLVDELVPTFDPDDPTYHTRMEGLEIMRKGLVQFVQGALAELEDRASYSSNARAQFVEVFSVTYPKIAARLPAEALPEITRTIIRISSSESNPEIKNALLGITLNTLGVESE